MSYSHMLPFHSFVKGVMSLIVPTVQKPQIIVLTTPRENELEALYLR